MCVCALQAVSEQIAEQRDAAEKEAREKETRVLSLTRELDEMMDKLEELERGKRQLQAELDELANNQGTADKNVSSLPFHVFHIFLVLCFTYQKSSLKNFQKYDFVKILCSRYCFGCMLLHPRR